ncbi:MAG: tRNA (cytidine(34)-2'-O)-methyltransferase [Gammaproteobacteria bacterium]|nr:tRNA (cytidine(34)-2'-O)-methyltransferase [Gammaproteobacteria bacterium]
MPSIVLYEPEIPPNTGNIIRLCANTGFGLHLVEPLGFSLDDKQLRRAGLDYREYANLSVHPDLDTCLNTLSKQIPDLRLFACTTKARQHHSEPVFTAHDVLLFGPESRGLPEDCLLRCASNRKIRVPMLPESRSLNLSNAVAIIAYEVWRQLGYPGSKIN